MLHGGRRRRRREICPSSVGCRHRPHSHLGSANIFGFVQGRLQKRRSVCQAAGKHRRRFICLDRRCDRNTFQSKRQASAFHSEKTDDQGAGCKRGSDAVRFGRLCAYCHRTPQRCGNGGAICTATVRQFQKHQFGSVETVFYGVLQRRKFGNGAGGGIQSVACRA